MKMCAVSVATHALARTIRRIAAACFEQVYHKCFLPKLALRCSLADQLSLSLSPPPPSPPLPLSLPPVHPTPFVLSLSLYLSQALSSLNLDRVSLGVILNKGYIRIRSRTV
jgi:hypothetical protein